MIRNSAPKSPASETRRETRLKLALLALALVLVAGYASTVTSMGEMTAEQIGIIMHSDIALLAIGITGAIVATGGLAYLFLRGRFGTAKPKVTDPAAAIANLAGRKEFQRILTAELAASVKTARQLAIHIVDIDRFRSINEVHGEAEGDAFLRLVTERLLVLVNLPERLARIGDDEFAIIQPEAGGVRHAEIFARRIHETIKDACAQVPRHARPGVSIGIAVAPDHGAETDKLVHSASLALRAAKKAGGDTIRIYAREMEMDAEARRQMERAISDGLHQGWFELHFQPQYDLGTRRLTGFEALVRMNHPELGELLPAAFVPIADESGLILPLGEWIIHEAVSTAAEWPPYLSLSINVSLAQFRHGDVAHTILHALANAGLPGPRLKVEISEAALLNGSDTTTEQIRRLRSRGVTIVLDDFGVDRSRLTLLTGAVCNAVKLDCSLIESVSEPGMQTLVRSLIGTAQSFALEIHAEGIERPEQAHFLMSHDCQKVQGFLFGRPMPKQDLGATIAKDMRNALPPSGSMPAATAAA